MIQILLIFVPADPFVNDNMMTSSNRNIFRVTGPLCGEFTGPGEFPAQGQWRGTLMFSFTCVRINDWVKNRAAGDLIRHRGHYDVNVMGWWLCCLPIRTLLWRHNGLDGVSNHQPHDCFRGFCSTNAIHINATDLFLLIQFVEGKGHGWLMKSHSL